MDMHIVKVYSHETSINRDIEPNKGLSRRGPVTAVCLPFAYVGETDLSSHHDPVTIGWGETRAEGGANAVLKQVRTPYRIF